MDFAMSRRMTGQGDPAAVSMAAAIRDLLASIRAKLAIGGTGLPAA